MSARQPIALDAFCCGGGSTTGLQRAGFRVVGVDWKRQKEYRGDDFIEADLSSIETWRRLIADVRPNFISSSPPCQQFSSATPKKNRMDHPNLIPVTRQAIRESGVPGWIENVSGAPLEHAIRLCGPMFHATFGVTRHRFFELIGWFAMEPVHRWHTYLPPEPVTWTDPLGVTGTTPGAGKRVVVVAGHGPPDATQSARYKARRDVESVHDGSMMTNSRKARARRATTGVYGFVDAPDSTRARERRLTTTIAGDGGSSPGFGGDKEKRAEWRRCAVVTICGENGVRQSGQNRPGPECIRWRTAMGWIDGPRSGYALAQAVPPAYAEWLGRAFLARGLA